MVGIVASRRRRAHRCTCIIAQVPGQMCRPIVGRKMVGGMLIGALSISLLATGARVTIAQSSTMSPSKPATKARLAQEIPPPPSPPELRDARVTVPLPSPDLLEHQGEPDCEIPSSDSSLGAIPQMTRLIYERQCYKNAETVVRSKLQLLQDAIASTVKALNDAGATKSPQLEGGEQGAPASAKDPAIALEAGASAKSSEPPGNAGDQRDAKNDPSGDQGGEPPHQHRKPTPSSRLPVNLSSEEGDVPKSSSPDAAVSEQAHHGNTRRTQTPDISVQSKPVMASANAVACQASRPAGPGPSAWRLIDGRKCWYEGAVGMDKSLLHWPPPKTTTSVPLGFLYPRSAANPSGGRSDR